MSVIDANPAPAVVLLARPGPARDNLRIALAHAGVALVLEEDPNTVDTAELLACAPQAVVVALEPAVEEALERLEPVLSAPGFMLVFDEAELAARRDGWDAQRWGRHLAAKLHGHQQVLPPGAEEDVDLLPEPGLPETPEHLHEGAPLAFHLHEAADAADAVPADGMYAPPREYAEPVSLEEALAAMQPAPVGAADAVAPATDTPAPPAPAPMAVGDHSSWALLDDDAAVAAPSTNAAPPPLPAFDLDRLSVVEIEPPPAGPVRGAPGAVLVLAGIGGPDALRRLLGALPAQLDVPVLVHMPLDGARYGNLVKQMARVSALPVVLAEAGQPADAGQIYILSDDVGAGLHEGGLHFHASTRGMEVSSLPATESAVILLSGADLAQVDPALSLAEAGAWVGGQVGDGCYDPAAATAVVAAGMFAGEPQELAQAIAARWMVHDQEPKA